MHWQPLVVLWGLALCGGGNEDVRVGMAAGVVAISVCVCVRVYLIVAQFWEVEVAEALPLLLPSSWLSTGRPQQTDQGPVVWRDPC